MSERRIKVRYQLDGADEFKRRQNELGDSGERSFNRMRESAIRYASAAAAAFSVREIVQYADAYKTLENQIKVASDGVGDITENLNTLFGVAQRTRIPLDATVQLYQRASMAANELGASQAQLFEFTENVGMALAVQGGAASQASGALLQLAQALGSGIVRSEEFNSILEGAFPIAQAAARGIEETGGSVAKLRQMIADGKITSDAFFRAILSQSAELAETFGRTEGTVGQSLTKLNNAFTVFIGQSEEVSFGAATLAGSIELLAENLDELANVATVAAVFVGGRYAASMTAAAAANVAFAASTVSGTVALGRLAFGSTAAAAGMTALRGAVLGASAAFKVFVPLAAAAAIFEMVDGNESLAKAISQVDSEVQGVSKELRLQFNVHGELTDEAVEKVNERIRAYQREAKALETILSAQLDDRSDIGLIGRGIKDFAAETVLEGIFGQEYESLDEVVKKQKRYQKAIFELEQLLADPSSGLGSPGGSGGGTGGGADEQIKKRREYREELGRTIEELERLAEANDVSAEAHARMEQQIRIENEARKLGIEIGSESYEQLEDDIRLRDRLKKQIEDINKIREEEARRVEQSAEIYKEFARSVQNTLGGAFADLYGGEIRNLEAFTDRFKRVFTDFLGDLTALALQRRIVIPIVAAAGSAIGLDSDQLGSLGQELGGGSGVSDMLSLGSNLSSLGGGFNQSIFAGTGLGSAIDTFAFNNFGVGQSVAQANAVLGVPSIDAGIANSTFSGQGGITANFTPGNMLGGFAGNMGANLLFGDDRGIGASIGGGLGGIAGGAALSAPLTAALGAIGGPLGFAIGAFAGNALGGLFGNKKPSDKGQWATADLTGALVGEGGLEGKKFSEENRNAAKQLSQLGASITDLLDNIDGVSASFDKIQVKIGNRDSNYLAFLDEGEAIGDKAPDKIFTGRSQPALMDALLDGVIGGLEGLPDELKAAFERIDFSGPLDEALSDVQFIASYDAFGELATVMSDTEVQVRAMKEQFARAAETAERLGLAVDKVNEAEAKQLAEMNRSASQGIAAAILGITDPAQLVAMEEQRRFQQQLADLYAIEATQETINQAQLLHQLRMQQAVSQTGGAVSDTVNGLRSLSGSFDKLLDDLRFGRFSGQSPSQNLAVLEAEVQALAAAPEDDVESKQRLAELLPAFLELSAAQNGFNAEYAKDRDWAERVAMQTLNDADRQVALMEDQLSATVSGFAGLNQSIQELMDSFGVTSEQLVASAGSAPHVFNASSYLAGNPDVAAAARAYVAANGGSALDFAENHYNRYGMFEGRSPSGFAAGGLVTGGLPGVDSVPILAMQGERVLSVPHSRMMEDIYGMARRANNDNQAWRELKAELADVKDQLSRILVAGFEGAIDSQERHRLTTERLTEKPRFAV